MSEFNKILFIFIQTSLVFCYTSIDDLKNDNYNFLSKSKFKYFSIKKNIFSPYENYNNSIVNYADSLQILLKSIEDKRMLMFADIKDIELSNEDIIYIDKLNNEFIAVIRVVNDFYKILVEVSKFDNRTNYTIREYANDINSLYLLEKNIN